jgi:hypothetical protein
MNFKSYPNATDTPNRKRRKGERNTVFLYNKKLRNQIRREKRIKKGAINEG